MMMHNLADTKLQRQIGPMFDVCLGMQVIQDINHRLSFHPAAEHLPLPRQLGTVAVARKARRETEVLEEHHLQIQRDNKLLRVSIFKRKRACIAYMESTVDLTFL